MSKKKIVARVGEYTNQQGEKKGNWVDIGVIMTSESGVEYAMINPTVNLAGVLTQQNMFAVEKKKAGDQKARTGTSVMCSIFSDEPRKQQQSIAGGPPTDDDIPF